jgi:hypothetical protein
MAISLMISCGSGENFRLEDADFIAIQRVESFFRRALKMVEATPASTSSSVVSPKRVSVYQSVMNYRADILCLFQSLVEESV